MLLVIENTQDRADQILAELQRRNSKTPVMIAIGRADAIRKLRAQRFHEVSWHGMLITHDKAVASLYQLPPRQNRRAA